MRVRLVAVAIPCLALCLVLAACAGPGGPAPHAGRHVASRTKGPYPASVRAADGRVTVKTKPHRIVSLSPSLTEMLYAIGAGKQVVAVDNQSDYPPSAPRTKLSGFQPNVEAVAGYDPDLVMLSYNANHIVAGMRKLSVPVYDGPAARTLRDTYRQITQLGRLTGHLSKARALVARMKRQIKAIAARAPHPRRPLTFYHELDPQRDTMTSKSFVGQVYRLAGLKDIADAANTKGQAFTKLSSEYIVAKNPDVIFLADAECCGQSPRTVAGRPGWSHIAAVKHHDVFVLNADVSSRWGPRVVDFLRSVVRDARKAEKAAGKTAERR